MINTVFLLNPVFAQISYPGTVPSGQIPQLSGYGSPQTQLPAQNPPLYGSMPQPAAQPIPPVVQPVSPAAQPSVTGGGRAVIPARPLGAIPGTVTQGNPAAPPQNIAPQAPFELTPLEQQQLDIFLTNWDRKCQTIKAMECEFHKFEYNSTMSSDANQLIYATYGVAKYAVPNKGLFWEQGEFIEGKPVAGQREFKAVCDGKSYFLFTFPVKDPMQKQPKGGEVVEYPLPENMRGSRTFDSPIMFVVGAKPQELKERFFLRLTPHSKPEEYIVLEAHPKLLEDAKEFRMVQIIVYAKNYDPYGMKQFHVNGTGITTFVIKKSTINPTISVTDRILGVLGGGKDDFDNVLGSVPSTWTHRIDNELLQSQQSAGTRPNVGMR
jgi:TIGR03009 family protein